MQLIKAPLETAEAVLRERLLNELNNSNRVLFLLSGGSNIQTAVRIISAIPENLKANLSISLIDERYGDAGHSDSNWQQLLLAGLTSDAATFYQVLQGKDLEETREAYEAFIKTSLEENDISVGLLGIGPDGHTAGILPNSPAASENSQLVAGYTSEPYKRLTLTFPALKKLSTAYIFAYGETKKPTLQQLKSQNIDLSEQPAQILKQLKEAYLYNDQVEE